MKTQLVLSALFIALLQSFHSFASAHDDDLKAGILQPTIGILSEEVARQKLTTYGVTNITELTLIEGQYMIKGTYNDKPVELQMNAQSGLLTQKGTTIQLPVAESVKTQVIRGHHIKLNRQELTRPELIQAIEPVNR